MTVIVRRDDGDPTKWVVIEETADGLVTIGGPFDTRSYARQVAEGATIMAQRLAAKRGAVGDRHWYLLVDPKDGLPFEVHDDKDAAEHMAGQLGYVVVDVVRAAADRGAVEEIERLRMLVCTCRAYDLNFSAEGPPPHRADCPAVPPLGGQ